MPTLSQILSSASDWTDAGLGLVYPEVCQICRESRATPRDGYVCDGCRARVAYVEPPLCQRCGRPFTGDISEAFECGQCRGADLSFSFARSAVIARATVLDAIHLFKYNSALWLEPFLADLLVARAKPQLAGQGWELVVPVPLHPAKRRERGFNQSALLARRLASALALPISESAAQRILPTRTQTRLTRSERQQNVHGAFAARRCAELNGRRVILVDDVFTTGSTTDACAEALRRAGAAEVCVWTLARGI